MLDALWLLASLSLAAGLMTLLLFALHPLWKNRLSKTWQYYIWTIVLLRLVLPFAPPHNLMGAAAHILAAPSAPDMQLVEVTPSENLPLPTPPADDYVEQSAQSATTTAPTTPVIANAADAADPQPLVTPVTVSTPLSIPATLLLAWAVVATALLARKLIAYNRCCAYWKASRRRVTNDEVLDLYDAVCAQVGVRREPPVYYSAFVATPMLMGTFRPYILLPDDRPDDEQLRNILLHELMHHKRHDIVYKWVVHLLVCLHWFNPALYLMRCETGKLCELSCDERVLQRLGEDGKRSYGATLLDAVRPAPDAPLAPPMLSMSEDARLLKERLGFIKRFQGCSRLVRTVSVLAAVALVAVATLLGVSAAPTASIANATNPGTRSASGTGNNSDSGSNNIGSDNNTTPALGGVNAVVNPANNRRITLTDTANVQTIVLKVDSTAIRVVPSAADVWEIDYHNEWHAVRHTLGDRSLDIVFRDLPPDRQNDFGVDQSAVLYVPQKSYELLRIDSEDSAVTLCPVDAALNLRADSSAVTMLLPEGAQRPVGIIAEDSAFTVLMPRTATDYTLTLLSESSAASISVDGLPSYLPGRAYSHSVGNGAAAFNITADSCAFAVSDPSILGDNADRVIQSILGNLSENSGYYTHSAGANDNNRSNYNYEYDYQYDYSYDYSQLSRWLSSLLDIEGKIADLSGLAGDLDDLQRLYPSRISRDDLPDDLDSWFAGCTGLSATSYGGRYYVYCATPNGTVQWAPSRDSSGNWTISVWDASGLNAPGREGYVLFSVPRCDQLLVTHGNARLEFGGNTVVINDGTAPELDNSTDIQLAANRNGYSGTCLVDTTNENGVRAADGLFDRFTGTYQLFEVPLSAAQTLSVSIEAAVSGDYKIAFLNESGEVFFTASSYLMQRANRPVEFPAGTNTVVLVGEGASGVFSLSVAE